MEIFAQLDESRENQITIIALGLNSSRNCNLDRIHIIFNSEINVCEYNKNFFDIFENGTSNSYSLNNLSEFTKSGSIITLEKGNIIYITSKARKDKRLFIPISNTLGIGKISHAIYTIDTLSSGGLVRTMPKQLATTTAIGSICRQILLPIDNECFGAGYNLFLPTTSTEPDNAHNHFLAPDGTVFLDLTKLRIIRYHTYGFNTMVIINGCFLTNEDSLNEPVYFSGKSFIFKEKGDCIEMIENSKYTYIIKPSDYKVYDGRPFLFYKSC